MRVAADEKTVRTGRFPWHTLSMRPVTNPPPPTSAYDESAQLAVAVRMATGGNENGGDSRKKRALADLTKAEIITRMEAQLNIWIGAGAPLNGGSPDFNDETVNSLYGDYLAKLADGSSNWGNARRELINRIGAYCSYCGSSVFSHLAIEHRLPKSTFPAKAFHYPNFLLACSSCNSAKGNNPNQATAPGHPLVTDQAINVITNLAGHAYYWPDFADPDFADPTILWPFPFRVSMNWITPTRTRLAFGNVVLPQDMGRLREKYVAGELMVDRGLYYEPYGPAGRYKHYFGVALGPTPNMDSSKNEAVQRIIDLASLNRVLLASQAAGTIDRRIETRTKAYFTANIIKEQLDQAVAIGPELYALVKEQAAVTIANTGHWLVWLNVFRDANYFGTPAQEIIRQCFQGTSTVNWVV